MRVFMNIVEEIEDISSIWGFWVTADGDIVQVTDHHAYAESEFGAEPDGERPIDYALDQGWVRVICVGQVDDYPEFNSDWQTGKVTRKARMGLKRLIENLPEYDHYYVGREWFSDVRKATAAALRKL